MILDFSKINDEFNWVTNSNNAVKTEDDNLVFNCENDSIYYERKVDELDGLKTRIRVVSNITLFRPLYSIDRLFKVRFALYCNNEKIGEGSVFDKDLVSNEKMQYNFDRMFNVKDAKGDVTLRVYFDEGFENELQMSDLKVESFVFDDTNVRAYFVFDDFLKQSLKSSFGFFYMRSWKIDGFEILSEEFLDYNSNLVGTPSSWFFAKANLDGTERLVEWGEPNTFNPFIKSFKSVYDNSSNNFYGGNAISNQYSDEFKRLGFLKPKILNGNLEEKTGAFFIDFDSNKKLEIDFELLLTKKDETPLYHRKYKVLWDAKNCTKSFTYDDVLNGKNVNDDVNGFLSGLTGGISDEKVLLCSENLNFNGGIGTTEYTMEFGTDIGWCGIEYQAHSVPDRFEIEWNEQYYDTGYVGSYSKKQDLLNAGVPDSDISLVSGTNNGKGLLIFEKTTAYPTKIKVKVTGILGGTAWNIKGLCVGSVPGKSNDNNQA